MRFGLVPKKDVYDHSLLAWQICLCLAKTVRYEVIVCLPAGKMVFREPTNPEAI